MVDTSSSDINLTKKIIRSNGQKLKLKDEVQHHQSPRPSRVETLNAGDDGALIAQLPDRTYNK
jgi:hypothetical protein